MSVRKPPKKVKLFFSIFSQSKEFLLNAIGDLCRLYGEIDNETEFIPFDNTRYYEKEFGPGLIRKLISFKNLIFPNEIVDVKLKAYELEEKYSESGRRKVNIDPGYVALSRVVLTTGKDYTHRIYLEKGVYADLTLIYKKDRGFIPLTWTYPDYASKDFCDFFIMVRQVLKDQLRGEDIS